MNTSLLVKVLLVAVAAFVVYKVAASRTERAIKSEKFDAVVDREFFTGITDSETLPPDWAPTQRSLPSPPPMSTAANLLPKPKPDGADDFSQFAPKALSGVNLLDASQTIGVDTQGSSLKISSWDIRGMPANPRTTDVGPWQQSTYQADLTRKRLD